MEPYPSEKIANDEFMREQIIKRLIKSGDAQQIWTAKLANSADRHTIKIGVDAKLLMENAGKSVADAIFKIINQDIKKPRILIFAGPGNNGADAVVTSRHLLAHNLAFSLYLVNAENTWNLDLAYQFGLLKQIIEQTKTKKVQIKYIDCANGLKIKDKTSRTIIVDGIFGAGLSRPPEGPALHAINAINRHKENYSENTVVISIDVPSGLTLEASIPMGKAIKADHTITFGYLKRVHISEPTKEFCGRCYAKEIGLFSPAKPTDFLIGRKKALINLFLPAKKISHKGQFGHILVLEGHDRFLGASRLSARAALRAGAGLVTIATKEHGPPLAIDLAEFMRCPIKDISDDLLNKIDALVVGPGLSDDESCQNLARTLLNQMPDCIKFIVLDADGLKLLTDKALTIKNKLIIATPHAKEAARLLGWHVQDIENNRFLAIEGLANISSDIHNQVIWVLKGGTTLVRGLNGNIFAFRGDLPVLSAAGSGDVLAGAIAGLIKQTPSPLAAVLLAVSFQIESAKILSKSIFKGSLASELADMFPKLTHKRPVKD